MVMMMMMMMTTTTMMMMMMMMMMNGILELNVCTLLRRSSLVHAFGVNAHVFLCESTHSFIAIYSASILQIFR